MMKNNLSLLLGLWLAVQTVGFGQVFPFDLTTPTRKIVLDSTLREISGLSAVPGDTSLIACVHDEAGVVIFLRKIDGSVACKMPFKGKGDFEGIEVVGKIAYVMKSNGDLYRIDLTNCKKPKISTFETGMTKDRDIESLCIDASGKYLLFASKENSKLPVKRSVYRVALNPRSLDQVQVLFEIDPETMRAHTVSEKGDKHYFSPSGLSVDPLSGNLYILSSASRQLGVFSSTGEVIMIKNLDKSLFAQPEGIFFDNIGNMYISNEAKYDNTPSTIVYFVRT